MAIKIFITGTDTDIGKTVISGLFAGFLQEQGLDCGYLKLVSCGGEECGDCALVQQQAGVATHNVLHFPLAASPHLAAEQAGQSVDLNQLDQAIVMMAERHEIVLIEGAGGVLVPLSRDLLLVDYMAGQDVQALVVARSGLGTINQTLLTLDALRHRQIQTLGVVFNDEVPLGVQDLVVADNQRAIQDFADVLVLGRMPRFSTWAGGRQDFTPIGRSILGRVSQQCPALLA